MTFSQLSKALLATIILGAPVAACAPGHGHHPHSDVPENHAREHKPKYMGGQVEEGELEPVAPDANIVRAEPPIPDHDQMTVTAVILDIGITEACKIEQVQTYFDYDSAKLDPAAKAMLVDLAACVDDGALAGRELEIVGFTDPRGDDSYNRDLGESRAESVSRVLIDNGVPSKAIEIETRGEVQASDNPSEWPEDRRVEVRLQS